MYVRTYVLGVGDVYLVWVVVCTWLGFAVYLVWALACTWCGW